MELRPSMNLLPVSISLLLVLLVSMVSSLPVTSRPTQHKRNALLEGRNCTRSTTVNEGSSSGSRDTSTTDEMASTQTNCKTLKQLLHFDYRGGTRPFTARNSLFPFFVHHEMLFDHEDFDSVGSTGALQNHERNCESLIKELNRNVPARSICSWTYSCTYNPNQFPAFDIQATECAMRENSGELTIRNAIRNNAECTELTQQIQYAIKEDGCWKMATKIVRIGCECVMKE